MEMDWEIRASSWSNMQSNLGKSSTHEEDAYKVFDQMLTSESDDLRRPNRILEVTIHKVCYPITKSLLCQIFGPFGVVEDIYLYNGWDWVEARVIFQSKQQACDAFGELHGRNIYDGCCQMEIKWGFSQEPNVSVVSSNSNTTASSSSVLFPSGEAAVSSSSKWFLSTAASMSTIDELFSEKFRVEADASGEHTKATALVEVAGGSTIAIPLVTNSDRDIDGELHVPEVATIVKEAAPGPDFIVLDSSANRSVGSNISIGMSSNCSTKCPIILAHTLTVTAIRINDRVPTSSLTSLLLTLRFDGPALHPLKWFPSMPMEFMCDNVEIRPRPWPSFLIEVGVSSFWCSGLFHPPTWLLIVGQKLVEISAMRFRRNLSLGDATMLQVLEMPLMNFWQVYYSGLEMRWTSLVLAKIAVTLSDQFPSCRWMLIQESNQCVCGS